MPTERPSTRPKPTRMLGAKSSWTSRNSSSSSDRGDHVVHVVRLVGAVGDEGVERAVAVGDVHVRRLGVVLRRRIEVVLREERQHRLQVLDGVLLVGGQVVGVARLGVVGARAAEVLHRDVLAGDGLDHVGTGDEHRRGLVDHDREVGDRGGVDVPAGAVAHDQADLRDDAGGVDVAAEDLAVEAQRDDALLDAGAGSLVDADDRAAGAHRQVHDLGDLLAVDLAERAAEDGEVLAEDADHAAVDLAVAGHHAVAVRAGLLQPERSGAVAGELVELDEGALVEEHLDALAGGLAALRVLLLHGLRRPGVHGLVEASLEVGELAGGRVQVDLVGDVGPLTGLCAHARASWIRLVGVSGVQRAVHPAI